MRVALLALASVVVGAQALEYRTINTAGPRPSGRFDGTLVYDPPGNQLLLFGGSDDSNNRNDLWAYSIDRNEWRELNPSGAKPAPRFGQTFNYDPVRRRAILFGGEGSGFFSDVWAYDVARNEWRMLADNNAGPSRRYGHSGIYDGERDRIVISHGFTDRGRFDDTWAFDLASNRWSDLSPQGARPVRRCLHHAEYDRAGSQMLLFGGCASGFGPCPLGDLWSFDLRTNRWTEIRTSPAPPARQHFGFAFDERRRRLVLFAGSGAELYNDTWEFDPSASQWSKASFANAPSPRLRLQGVYARGVETVYFFGGTKDGRKTDELVALGVAKPSLVNAFSQAQGAVAPGSLVTLYGTSLGPEIGVLASGGLAKELGNVSITVSGVTAPLLYAQSRQLNFQIPYEVEPGLAQLAATVNGRPMDPLPVAIAATAPGLHGTAFKTGGVITLFATGAGATSPTAATGELAGEPFARPIAPVSLRVGGRPAEILFAGLAPGTAGVLQINAQIPEGVSGSAIAVVLRIGDAETSATVTVRE